MKATVQTYISRPIETVFDFTSDVRNMDRWVAGVSDVRITSRGEFGVGSTFTSDYTYGGKTHRISYEVVELTPPRRQVIRSTSGPFPFAGTLELEPFEGGTKVFNTIDAGANGVGTRVMFLMFGPILRMMMRKQLSNELVALKATLEKSRAS